MSEYFEKNESEMMEMSAAEFIEEFNKRKSLKERNETSSSTSSSADNSFREPIPTLTVNKDFFCDM